MLQVDRTYKNIIRIINDVEFSIDIESNSEVEDFSVFNASNWEYEHALKHGGYSNIALLLQQLSPSLMKE